MVSVTRKIEFAASHFYHQPNLTPQENQRLFGKCNRPLGHGHNYTLEVTIAGTPDAVTGMVLDLSALKELLERVVMQRMDHRFLNYEVPELAGLVPTCENIAVVIWKLLEAAVPQGQLTRVRLWESPELFVDCFARERSEEAQ
jgi:6-pyruvoyltetrahydropterin/6-carboxytetrahydropterin synthase